MSPQPSIVGFIPARSGSKRVPDKNIKPLSGHPLLAYSIASALASGVFERVIVVTDSDRYADIARHYEAEVPFLRPAATAGDVSSDIEWLDFTLRKLAGDGYAPDCFAILRPTSPFRLAATIQRAWDYFLAQPGIDSIRAVELCAQHPGKMWVVKGERMYPLLPLGWPEAPGGPAGGQPWHSSQYPSLPKVYVQNASLEMAWSRVVLEDGLIAGQVIAPFYTKDWEGFDVNRPYDWGLAEAAIASGEAEAPTIKQQPYQWSD